VAPGKLSAIRGRGWQTFGKKRAGCNAVAGAGSVVVPPHAAKHSLGWRQGLTKGPPPAVRI